MSYFAKEGGVRCDDVIEEGEIEITEEQYLAAIAGVIAGKLITIDGGFAVVDPPEPEPEEPGPEPDPYVPVPVCCAAAFGVAVDAGSINVIESSAGIGAALYLDVGSYMLFFTVAQSDTNYYPKVFDSGARMRVVDKGVDYIIVSADQGGSPIDPETFSVEIWRAQ